MLSKAPSNDDFAKDTASKMKLGGRHPSQMSQRDSKKLDHHGVPKRQPKPTLGEHSLRRRSEADTSYEKRANETPKRSKSPVQQTPPTDAKRTEKRTVTGNRTALRFFQKL